MALFGSKPLVDLDTVTGPVKTPVINQPGFGGYIGRVLDPTTNNSPLGRALGLFGQGLMAQQPGIGGDIGRSLMGVQEQQRAEQDRLMDRNYQQSRIDVANRQASMPKVMSGPNGSIIAVDPATGQAQTLVDGQQSPTTLQRNYEWFSSLPPEQQKIVRPMMTGYGLTPEGIEAAGARQDATSAAAARYRASGGGGGGKPSATRSVGGKVYYKVNGRWYDNPEGS